MSDKLIVSLKMSEKLIISFRGGIAEEHKLPAYAAGQALSGVARSILIPMMYLVEGKVRHRKLDHQAFSLHLLTTRPGSFESVYELATNPAVAFMVGFLVDVGKDAAKEVAVDFVKSVINRCAGKSAAKSIEDLEINGRLSEGDMQALVEAVEPAMREAHVVIGNGATNIVIVRGDKNIISLNANTKAFVLGSDDDEKIIDKDFSIASFNANTSYGRAYDYDEKRTIPFTLDPTADAGSINAIGQSLLKYARVRHLGEQQSSRVHLRYTRVLALDGRVKKLKVLRARAV